MWLDEFVREIQSDEALQTFRIPVGDASSLNDAMRNRTNVPQAELFRLALVDWIERRVQKGTPPECVREFIGDKQPPDPHLPRGIGWPMKPDTPGVRVSLFQVWSLFLQDYLKQNDQVFRILTIDWLSSIDSRLKDFSFSREELIAVVKEPLGELREELIALHDDVTRLIDEVGGISVSVGELLPLVIAFREEVGRHFGELRAELAALRDLLAAIKQGQDNLQRGQRVLHDDVLDVKDDVRTLVNRAAGVSSTVPRRAPLQLPPAASAGTLYGRVKQCHDLDEALRARKNVAVLGPAGYGKTALAAKAVRGVVGETPQSLAGSPYPDGVLFVNLYGHRGRADAVWHVLADDLAGSEFRQRDVARVRATEACRAKQILVILEGGEEADGKEDRTSLPDLLSVLAPENRVLLLTRDKSQTQAGATIHVEEPLSDLDAGRLFDKLTRKRVF